LGKNVRNNLDFGKKVDNPPMVFGVNYFLKDINGNYLNDPKDKHVWVKWMELRVHGEVDAIKTPTGYIPMYEDLCKLFKEVRGVDYTREDYNKQFTIRVDENMAKIKRVREFYKNNVTYTPEQVFWVLNQQYERLLEAKEKHGSYILPEELKE
jgi:phosphoenolpyruvate carboxykinase (GTP)